MKITRLQILVGLAAIIAGSLNINAQQPEEQLGDPLFAFVADSDTSVISGSDEDYSDRKVLVSQSAGLVNSKILLGFSTLQGFSSRFELIGLHLNLKRPFRGQLKIGVEGQKLRRVRYTVRGNDLIIRGKALDKIFKTLARNSKRRVEIQTTSLLKARSLESRSAPFWLGVIPSGN